MKIVLSPKNHGLKCVVHHDIILPSLDIRKIYKKQESSLLKGAIVSPGKYKLGFGLPQSQNNILNSCIFRKPCLVHE